MGVVFEKIKNYDFNAAHKYWLETKGYWKIVRESWNDIINKEKVFCMKKSYEETPLFMYHFLQAEEFKKSRDVVRAKKDIDETIGNFISNKCKQISYKFGLNNLFQQPKKRKIENEIQNKA